MPSLTAVFIEALSEPLRGRAAAIGDLETLLGELVQVARAEWTELNLPNQTFVAHLARRLTAELPLEQALDEIRAVDLYLACACAQGDPKALAAFEERYLGEVDAAVARLNSPAALVDDVRQMIKEKLFVAGAAGRPPRISDYGGRGDLRTWVRVTVTRNLLNLVTRGNKEIVAEDLELFDVPGAELDPELEHLKTLYRGELKAIFPEAVAQLTGRERNLLRHRFVDELTVDEICALYGVHPATVARWLAKARKTLVAQLRRRLIKRLGIDQAELNSIMRLIQSRLDLSMSRFLKAELS